MENLLAVFERKHEGSDETFNWNQIVEWVAEAFRFTSDEKRRFAAKKLAKLVAAIPFLAGCKDPSRTAVSHLGTYVLSVKLKHGAVSRPSDDESLFRRIELLGNFIGGDPEIIQRGMNLIALCMISNYVHDAENDKTQGKYNPVVAGVVDAENIRLQLVQEIESVPCSDMDEIMTPKLAWDPGNFWLY